MEEHENPRITEDENAPLLYTKRSIQLFSVLFSVFFGSVLLAINLRTYTGNRMIYALTILSGFALNFLLYSLAAYFGYSGAGGVLANGLLGVVLTEILWRRYIGEEIPYRKRPITIPLIIGLAISFVMVFLIIRSAGVGV